MTLRGSARSRAALQLEVLALQHQLQVLQRTRPRRVRPATADRWLWVWLSRIWTGWRTALAIVKPETVIAWHRRGFRLFWTWKSRRRTGRPTVPRMGASVMRVTRRPILMVSPPYERASVVNSKRRASVWLVCGCGPASNVRHKRGRFGRS